MQTDQALINDFDNMLRWTSGQPIEQTDFEQLVFDVVATGDLLPFNERVTQLAVGAHWRKDVIEGNFDPNLQAGNFFFNATRKPFEDERTIWALFAELAVPLSETVDLQLALRHERYAKESLDSTDPKLSVLWTPLDDLSFRASFSTAFRVPSVPRSSQWWCYHRNSFIHARKRRS